MQKPKTTNASDITYSPPHEPVGDVTRMPSDPTPSGAGWLSSSDAISHGRFAPGTVLTGRYRIVELLGKGGMGEVYRADDLKLGQAVALKFLPETLTNDATRLAQFHSEVRLARQIAHSNVCRVYDVDEVDGLPFLSMEYVDGEDLASLLRRIGRLPEDKALDMARQFCAGVAAAHDRGVLHRDLKPANVMIDGRGNVRVMDFGLAVAGGAAADVRVGTPAYMAPEQLAGREVSARSDLYAVGLVLYEMFTGKRAFDASTIGELVRQHADDITPPSSIVPSLDPAIERTILRCLEREPIARPGSALAISAALPGGDPLAAALAAGETPSPAMVAAAGKEDAISSRMAVGALAIVALALIVMPMVADQRLLLRVVPAPKPVDVLIDRAQQLRASFGYTDTPADEAHGIVHDSVYLQHIEATDQSLTRWERLRQSRPPVFLFWNRSSPRPLVRLGTILRPSQGDPPMILSGMTHVITDMQGRLLHFDAIVPQREPETTEAVAAPDWNTLFAAAELPIERFTPVSPTWTPRTFADTRAAWEGAWPDAPDVRVRIEAAAYRGRPVYFQVVAPWTRATRMESAPVSNTERLTSIIGALLIGLILITTGVAARRHLRQGKGDRYGADRIGAFIVVVSMSAWVVGAHHYANVNNEIGSFVFAAAFALFNAAVVWVFYLALEPVVRKWQPQTLVGWTRLMAGRINDPHVGRDLLVGLVAGAIWLLIRAPRGLTQLLVGVAPSAPLLTSVAPLLGMRSTIAEVATLIPSAVATGMILILIFAVARTILRRTWITAVALGLVLIARVAVELLGGPGRWTEFVLVIPAVVLIFVVIARFGLLATIVMIFLGNLLEQMPLTVDPNARYFGTSMWILAGVLLSALFAARAARAGQPLIAPLSH